MSSAVQGPMFTKEPPVGPLASLSVPGTAHSILSHDDLGSPAWTAVLFNVPSTTVSEGIPYKVLGNLLQTGEC